MTGPCPCDGPDPAAAYQQLGTARTLATFIDESHLIIRARRCACGRAWLSIFTERVDFAGGDDPQRRDFIPLDEADVKQLAARPGPVTEDELLQFGALWNRRSLVRDWPGGAAAPTLAWRTGPLIIPAHD